MTTNNDKFKEAFVLACKYLQKNPPSYLATEREVIACARSNTYEDGWKQWALYFLEQIKE